MLRQVSSRNHRAKGFRIKNILQISLLLAVCVWLLYQIKHSHDKKKAFEERSSKNLFKPDESWGDIFQFGRKDLPHTVETDSIKESRIKEEENEETGGVEQDMNHEDSEDGGRGGGGRGGGDDEIDEQDQVGIVDEEADHEEEIADEEGRNEDKNGQVEESGLLEDQEHEEVSHEAREKSFEGDDASSAVVHDTQATEHEESSHEAQEMRFKGDDASSDVAHDAQVTEHEERPNEEREKSFNADDVSSAVELNTQVTESEHENGGSEGMDEKQLEKTERKEIENETVIKGTIDSLKSNYVGERELEVGDSPTLGVGSSSNSMAGESQDHMKQQADLPSVNLIGSQTEPQTNSTNVLSNAMEVQTNAMTTSDNKMEPPTNLTTVSNDQKETESNMPVINTVTNGVPLQNESTALDSVQGQNATVKMVTHTEDKSNLENIVMEHAENSNTTVRPEESGGSSTSSSTANENGKTISAESGNSFHNVAMENNGDVHTDQPIPQDIQNKAKSGGEEATE